MRGFTHGRTRKEVTTMISKDQTWLLAVGKAGKQGPSDLMGLARAIGKQQRYGGGERLLEKRGKAGFSTCVEC
jgi:hypothetical protein